MPGPHRRHRIDANRDEAIKLLEGMGAKVLKLDAVGGMCPDLVVGYRGINVLVEMKAESGTTIQQERFLNEWPGQVSVAYSPQMAVEQVLAAARKAGAL